MFNTSCSWAHDKFSYSSAHTKGRGLATRAPYPITCDAGDMWSVVVLVSVVLMGAACEGRVSVPSYLREDRMDSDQGGSFKFRSSSTDGNDIGLPFAADNPGFGALRHGAAPASATAPESRLDEITTQNPFLFPRGPNAVSRSSGPRQG